MLAVSSTYRHTLARRYAAYMPETIVRRTLLGALPTPGVVTRRKAATIFADVSGFTAMSEQLASHGKQGIEELNRILHLVFDPMIETIQQAGGAIAHFYGDAMLVYFPDCCDGMASECAIACAIKMQSISNDFQRITTILPTAMPTFDLGMKIGVGYGDCLMMVVGSAETGMEFVISGPAVEEATAAEKSAEAGHVVLGKGIAQCGYRGIQDVLRLVNKSDADDNIMTSCKPVYIDWDNASEQRLMGIINAAPHFIPDTVRRRIAASMETSIVEHCPVANIFVQFEGLDTESADYGILMQKYYRWAQDLVANYCPESGRVNRVLTGDKGHQLHIIIGAPEPLRYPEQAMRCALALQSEMPNYITSQRVGITIGSALACPVGSDLRHEYTVIGDVVNLASRLTQACEPGQILTDDYSAQEVCHAIDFGPISQRKMRGKRHSVAVCEPLVERSYADFMLI